MTKEKDDFLVDAVISAGELSESGYTYLDNELRVVEVAKHNIPYSEFLEWLGSPERRKRVRELKNIGIERFGKDYFLKYEVCCFCTSPHKD
jgi:hypothetical protein